MYNAIRLQGRGQVSSSGDPTLWWRTLWGLSVPPKVKVFVWKASLNWLPTQCNLAAHGIPTSTLCPICKIVPKTSFHALWGCKSLKTIARRTLDGLVPKFPPHSDIYSFLCECIAVLKKGEIELLVTVLWRIWFRRNKMVHDRSRVSDIEVVD